MFEAYKYISLHLVFLVVLNLQVQYLNFAVCLSHVLHVINLLSRQLLLTETNVHVFFSY